MLTDSGQSQDAGSPTRDSRSKPRKPASRTFLDPVSREPISDRITSMHVASSWSAGAPSSATVLEVPIFCPKSSAPRRAKDRKTSSLRCAGHTVESATCHEVFGGALAPNISGAAGYLMGGYFAETGALAKESDSSWGGDSSWNNGRGFSFDASRSSSVYGRSSAVQPQSLKVLLLIKS